MATLVCWGCDVEKEHTAEFFGKDKKNKSGLTHRCRVCINAYRRQWRAERLPEKSNPGRLARRRQNWRELPAGEKSYIGLRQNMKARYGITLEEYYEMLDRQQGVCAICGKVDSAGRRLAVDHCHVTKRVRGLLCGNCNKALGLLQDSADVTRAALLYLETS